MDKPIRILGIAGSLRRNSYTGPRCGRRSNWFRRTLR